MPLTCAHSLVSSPALFPPPPPPPPSSHPSELHLEGDFKKTKLKLTWLAQSNDCPQLELQVWQRVPASTHPPACPSAHHHNLTPPHPLDLPLWPLRFAQLPTPCAHPFGPLPALQHFGYLITKKKLEEEDNFEDYVNRDTVGVALSCMRCIPLDPCAGAPALSTALPALPACMSSAK